jgi:hypothetical protein
MALTGVAFLATAAGNYAYGLSQGTTDPVDFHAFVTNTKEIYSFGYLAIDGLAALLPAASTYLWRSRLWVPSVFVGILGAGFVAIAFINFLGFLGMTNANAMAARSHDAGTYQSVEEKLARLKQQRGWVEKARPADVIAAEIVEAETDKLFIRSEQCSKITKDDSRGHCDNYRRLQTELASAGQARRIDDEIDTAQARLDGMKKVVKGDFLAALANDAFSWREENVTRYKPFLAASALTLAHAFGLAIALLVLSSGRASASAPVQPASSNLPVIEVVRPPEKPSFLVPAPKPEPIPEKKPETEKALETATGQAPDSPGQNVTKFLPKPMTAEEGVEEWARSVEAGKHLYVFLKDDYPRYAKRRGIAQFPIHQLGTKLKEMGYVTGKDRKQGNKVYVQFPKGETKVRKAKG